MAFKGSIGVPNPPGDNFRRWATIGGVSKRSYGSGRLYVCTYAPAKIAPMDERELHQRADAYIEAHRVGRAPALHEAIAGVGDDGKRLADLIELPTRRG